MSDWARRLSRLAHEIEGQVDSAVVQVKRRVVGTRPPRSLPVPRLRNRGTGTDRGASAGGRARARRHRRGSAVRRTCLRRWVGSTATRYRGPGCWCATATHRARSSPIMRDISARYFPDQARPTPTRNGAWRRPSSSRRPGWVARVECSCPTRVPASGVVSDLDDTVIQTGVRRVLHLLSATFLENARTRLPFPGVAAFYQALRAEGPGISAESNLLRIQQSLELPRFPARVPRGARIPVGPLMLRDWGTARDSLCRRATTSRRPVHRAGLQDVPVALLPADRGQRAAGSGDLPGASAVRRPIAIASYLGKANVRPGDRRLLRALRGPERARLRHARRRGQVGPHRGGDGPRLEDVSPRSGCLRLSEACHRASGRSPRRARCPGAIRPRRRRDSARPCVRGSTRPMLPAPVGAQPPRGRHERLRSRTQTPRPSARTERAGDRHADLAGERDLLRDPVWASATAERLGNQVGDGRRDRNRREPDHGRPAAVAPARHRQHGSRSERQARIVGGAREPAHGAVDRRRGGAGDRRVDRRRRGARPRRASARGAATPRSRRPCRRSSDPGSGRAISPLQLDLELSLIALHL